MTSHITELQEQLKGLQSQMKNVEDDVTTTHERIDQAERDMGQAANELLNKNSLLHKVEAKINADGEETERCSVLLEGVLEKRKRKPREIASNLLKELGINHVDSDIRVASRMGQLQNNQRKGRAIKIKFSATFFKQEIYKNISKLKGNNNWEGIIVSDVLMQEEQSQRRDLRCIAAYAKSIDIDAKVKGDKLIIDEKVYISMMT